MKIKSSLSTLQSIRNEMANESPITTITSAHKFCKKYNCNHERRNNGAGFMLTYLDGPHGILAGKDLVEAVNMAILVCKQL